MTGMDSEDALIKGLTFLFNKSFQETINMIPKLCQENESSQMHSILKTIMRLKSRPPVIEGILDNEGRIVDDEKSVHNQVAQYFRDKFADGGKKTTYPGVNPPKFVITPKILKQVVERINVSKGNGYDFVPFTILKTAEGRSFLLPVINDLFKQKEPESRVFQTRLMLLSKSGLKYSKVNEIRPIAITTVPQKIIEHVLLGRLESELGSKLSRAQFGFREGRGTQMHVYRLIDRIISFKALKPKKLQNCLIFIDFSTAFDSIDHDILLEKIDKLGSCSDETKNLLKWYLSSIKLRIDDDVINQNRGSPQGGVASPFLWLLYMNDLLGELEDFMDLKYLFAFPDDLLVYRTCQAIARRLSGL